MQDFLPAGSLTTGNDRRRSSMVENGLDDAGVVSRWLQLRYSRKSAHTLESYAREAGRWLVFLQERGQRLASADAGDVSTFHDLLAAPPVHWLRQRGKSATAGLLSTQQLYGPLGARSIQHAHVVLQSLYGWLMAVGYATRNPFVVVAAPPVTVDADLHRYLPLDTWRIFWGAVTARAEAAPHDLLAQRDRFIVAFLYHTGLRVAELAAAGMADIRPDREGWVIHVTGKGSKRRKVTLNAVVMEELSRYRRASELTALPVSQEAGALVLPVRQRQSGESGVPERMTPGSLKGAWKALTRRALETVDDTESRTVIQAASIHWMRHTFGTHRLMAGASLNSTQDELGHADINTTRIYAETADTLRREDAEKHGRFGL